MWERVELGKIMRRQVRNGAQKMVVKDFLIEERIAEGDDWKVMTVVDQETMVRRTLKMILKNENMSKERKDQIFEQIKNQRKMSGRTNFIDLLEVYEDSETVYLLMEKWGTPLEKVLERRQTLMEKQVQLIFCQLVDILEGLRGQNITHGSINLFSVLLAPNRVNCLQLTNFSNSQDLSSDSTITKQGITFPQDLKARSSLDGSEQGQESDDSQYPKLKYGCIQLNEYTSPEEYHHEKEWNKKKLSERDIWSCGVLLYKLLTGQFPFSNDHGKLAPNKIKNATFSFPQLHNQKINSPGLGSSQFSHSFNCDFLSLEWKELLKKMMSMVNQRISLKELITHPFKEGFLELKTAIPDLKTSHPSLQNLLGGRKEKKNNLYSQSWMVNFQPEGESDEERDQLMILQDRDQNSRFQKEVPEKLGEEDEEDSFNQSRIFDQMRETFAAKQAKLCRLHRTQYGQGYHSKQMNQNMRHDSMGVSIKHKLRKEREDSLRYPLTLKSAETTSEKELCLAKSPIFITKFKYFKKEKYLGYILNNAVGIVYQDGDHLIGHTNKQFRYIEEVANIDSEIIGNQSDNSKQKSSLLKAMYRPRHSPNQSLLNCQDSFKNNKKNPNFRSEQVSNKELEKDTRSLHFTNYKCTQSDLLSSSNISLSAQKYGIYLRTIDHFGQRVVKEKLNLWVEQFWIDGNIYVFFLSNGCWQVVFLEGKNFRIYAVDQNGVGWVQDITEPPQVLYRVREIITKFQHLTKKYPKTGCK